MSPAKGLRKGGGSSVVWPKEYRAKRQGKKCVSLYLIFSLAEAGAGDVEGLTICHMLTAQVAELNYFRSYKMRCFFVPYHAPSQENKKTRQKGEAKREREKEREIPSFEYPSMDVKHRARPSTHSPFPIHLISNFLSTLSSHCLHCENEGF